MKLAWNLTERERLTLYYNSAEELGRLACVYFWLRAGVSPEWSVSFLEETRKTITRLKASDRAEKREDNRKDNKALR